MAKRPRSAMPAAAPVPPTSTAGVPGFAHFGGFIASQERRNEVVGPQKWVTFSDIATNFSIVASGIRHFLGLIARTEWTVEPAGSEDDPEEFKSAAKEAADFVESCLHDMSTPWSRVTRRASMYRFRGFDIQEWTAKRRQDGRIGMLNVAPRPCHTIDRWELTEMGEVLGMWQANPNTGQYLFLPRSKVMYVVDDALTDSPDGLGLLRHLVEPAERLKEYLRLEGIGYQRDLRGIPVGKAPISALNAAVKDGKLTKEQSQLLLDAMTDLVKMQAKTHDTGVILDSKTYESQTADGVTVSSVPQWAIDLVTGNATGIDSLGNAINRVNREMARILGVEQLMLGEGVGTRSLSEDKTSNFFLQVEGALADIAESGEKDFIGPLWTLNGFDDALKPTLKYEAVQFKDVAKITAALRDMATAGAVLAPNDPAINDVRDLLGVAREPELDPELLDAMNRMKAGLPADDSEPPNDPEEPMPNDPAANAKGGKKPPKRRKP
ncbi:hypothetical protein [Mesorhizobium sp.]|uniref:phage portal protein family protein n=1 Tax=Mesorhizobium sp. TaxID=1871066 RepID=UPI000FE7B47B|nr:hypothetical protein [Mesorhizobium sp.]RWB67558.1 MAG: hypothetical protein EOQ49_24885 [Mesorhizobium sp.]